MLGARTPGGGAKNTTSRIQTPSWTKLASFTYRTHSPVVPGEARVTLAVGQKFMSHRRGGAIAGTGRAAGFAGECLESVGFTR